jgi:hypothetical protein
MFYLIRIKGIAYDYADDRRQNKAAVLYLRLSKEQALRTDILVFFAV